MSSSKAKGFCQASRSPPAKAAVHKHQASDLGLGRDVIRICATPIVTISGFVRGAVLDLLLCALHGLSTVSGNWMGVNVLCICGGLIKLQGRRTTAVKKDHLRKALHLPKF